MPKKKNFNILIFIIFLFSFFWFKGTAEAGQDAYVTGNVFFDPQQLDDREEVKIPGIVVFREDKGSDGPWGSNRGPFSVTNNQGKYGFYPKKATGVSSYCGSFHNDRNKHCPAVNAGESASTANCYDNQYHCGFSCNSKNTPQRWLAYFPPDFDVGQLPPWIEFNQSDMKGGGSFRAVSASQSFESCSGSDSSDINVYSGNEVWTVHNRPLDLDFDYATEEYYIACTKNNQNGVGDINFEWIPQEIPSSFQCISLSPQPTDPQPGDKLTFTCNSLVEGKATIHHYNFRVNEATASSSVVTSDSQASFEYTVPAEGNYKVQCQVCASSDETDCTAWGQAE